MTNTVVPARYQADAAVRAADPRRGTRGGRRPDGRACSSAADPRASPARSTSRSSSRRTTSRDGLGEVEIGVLEKAEELGQHNLSGAVVNPRALPRALPGRRGRGLPVPPAGRGREGLPADAEKARRIPTPPSDAQPRQLHRVDLRDRALARRAGRGARRQRLHRLPGRRRCSCDGDAVVGVRTTPDGPGPRRQARRRATSRRPTSRRARRRTRRRARAARCRRRGCDAAGRRARRTPQIYALGVKEIWETKKPLDARDPHDGLAAAPRRVRRPLRLPARGEPGRARPRGRARLPKQTNVDVHVLTPAAEAAPAVRRYLEGGELRRVGGEDDPRGRLLRAARAALGRRRRAARRRARASSTCRRSRASTTRCSRASRRPRRSSRP